MSGEYFNRLIANGEWGVCLLSSCKVRYPQNKNIFEKSLKVNFLSLVLFDTETFVFHNLFSNNGQSKCQILQSITIPMIYRLFLFIFRYLIFLR